MIIRIFILLVIAVSVNMGCRSTNMTKTVFDKEGNVVSVNKIESTVLGTSKVSDFSVDLKKGKAKFGRSENSAGDMAGALLNLTEIAKRASGTP